MRVMMCSLYVATALVFASPASAEGSDPVKVTIDNYVHAESNTNMAGYVQKGAFGKFLHEREMVNAADQIVIRSNVDTLYSMLIVDLTTPVTIYLPDPGNRFQSLECLSEQHSIQPTVYGPGYFEFTQELMGTRYAFCVVRTFADPADPDDMKAAHALLRSFYLNDRETARRPWASQPRGASTRARACSTHPALCTCVSAAPVSACT